MKKLPKITLLEIVKNKKGILENPLPFHQKKFNEVGDTFMATVGAKYQIVFTKNAEAIKHILQKNHKNYNKSKIQTQDLGKYIGYGLLTTNGETWRIHRRMIQPAFHKKKLEGLLDIMRKAILNQLNNIHTRNEIDVFPIMGDLAFQVVAQSLFSADNIQQRMRQLQDITIANQEMLIVEMRQPYMAWWYKINGKIKHHLKKSAEAQEILNGIIEERLEEKVEKDDLLDMLLKAKYEDGTPMPRKQLIDEVMILFTAGHETTANALSFTLALLALNFDKQDKVFEEIKDLDLEAEDLMTILGQMIYTKQCIEEAMRLYPPAYFIDRASIEDDTVMDYSFKKNTVWLLNMYELHRHKEFWENPNDFIPERFAPENKKDYSDYYFPFGAGPRMCIGNNFAMYEMMLTVALVVKKYQLFTSEIELQVNPLITLRPKHAYIEFKERGHDD